MTGRVAYSVGLILSLIETLSRVKVFGIGLFHISPGLINTLPNGKGGQMGLRATL